MSEQPAPKGSAISQLLRIFWMLLGPAVLVYAGAYIIAERPGLPSYVDAIYWGGLAALLLARWLDIARFGGTTSDGGPATLADWRRYALVTSPVALVGWVLVHVAAAWLGG